MQITMVKKILADGSECRKCVEATDHLQSRGLWGEITDIVWARENDPESDGMVLGRQLGVERAPFFIVRDAGTEAVYTSVLQLVRERLNQPVSAAQQAAAIDADDIGGI